MTNFDIRLRRSQFTERRIQRHKNYDSLLYMHQRQHRKKIKGIVVIAFIILLALAIFIATSVLTTSKDKEQDKELPKKELQQDMRPQSLN